MEDSIIFMKLNLQRVMYLHSCIIEKARTFLRVGNRRSGLVARPYMVTKEAYWIPSPGLNANIFPHAPPYVFLG